VINIIKINKLIRNILIVVVIIALLLAFSSSYTSFSIDNLAFVVAIGIDKSSNNDSLKVSFQIAKPSAISENGSSQDSPAIINTVEANSINSAINLMNSYIGKELNLSHCKLIVISELVAKDGISDKIYTLINNIQIRPSTNVVISKADAKYYIENSKPSLETLPSKYYQIFPNSSKYTGYTVNATIGDFFNGLTCESCEPYAILGGIVSGNNQEYVSKDLLNSGDIKSNETSISGNRGTENIGLAVFKYDKLIGELNAIETVCFSIIKNQINGFLITITDPKDNEKYLDLYLYHDRSTKTKVDLINGSPFITVNCDFNGRIYSMKNDVDYLNNEVLEEISFAASKYMEVQMENYLYKTSKIYKSDIDGFGKSVSSNFLTIDKLEKFNWEQNYENSFFKVNANVNIKSGFLLTDT